MDSNEAFKIADRAVDLVREVLGLLTNEQIAEANDLRVRLERMKREAKK